MSTFVDWIPAPSEFLRIKADGLSRPSRPHCLSALSTCVPCCQDHGSANPGPASAQRAVGLHQRSAAHRAVKGSGYNIS